MMYLGVDDGDRVARHSVILCEDRW